MRVVRVGPDEPEAGDKIHEVGIKFTKIEGFDQKRIAKVAKMLLEMDKKYRAG